jgi:hypothetical protein
MNLSPEYFIVSGDKSTLTMRPVFGEYYTVLSHHVIRIGLLWKIVFLVCPPNQCNLHIWWKS